MPRTNRVDPWGDLHATSSRGLFTGNRGCVVNADEETVRHHASNLWIICALEFKGWRWPLARPGRWTPLFFLDDAVALAAGHRPCATCRHDDYLAYRDAVASSLRNPERLLASDLNTRLAHERLRPGRGFSRAHDRKTWQAPIEELPTGAVIVTENRRCALIEEHSLYSFTFDGWTDRTARPGHGIVTVLTPPTSVAALSFGFSPTLHPSAAEEAPCGLTFES
jgi:hypothetical protein